MATMKLADALTLRKELDSRVKFLMTPVGRTVSASGQVQIRVENTESAQVAVTKYLSELPSPETVLKAHLWALAALAEVEREVNLVNAATLAGKGHKTLAELLVERHALKQAHSLMDTFHIPLTAVGSDLRRVQVPNTTMEDLIFTSPKSEPSAIRQYTNHLSTRLRTIDSLVQQANWATDVEIPDWVVAGYDGNRATVPAPFKSPASVSAPTAQPAA